MSLPGRAVDRFRIVIGMGTARLESAMRVLLAVLFGLGLEITLIRKMSDSKTYGLTHLAIAVKDVQRTKEFYRTIFGMETMYDEQGFVQMTTPGCHDIIVFEQKDNPDIGKSGGIVHFGFRLKEARDMPEIVKRIHSAGGKIIEQGEFVTGSPYVFFNDPDGYEVEVWYELLPEN